MTDLAGKLEVDLEIKSSAEKFFKIFSSEAHNIPNAASDKIQKVEVHEGDWKSHGSVKKWTYSIDGNVETFKEKIEIDEPNMTLTMSALEGHVLDHYKVCKLIYKAIPKEDGAVVKVTLVYDKHHASVRSPQVYMDFVISLVKDIDAHLQKA